MLKTHINGRTCSGEVDSLLGRGSGRTILSWESGRIFVVGDPKFFVGRGEICD